MKRSASIALLVAFAIAIPRLVAHAQSDTADVRSEKSEDVPRARSPDELFRTARDRTDQLEVWQRRMKKDLDSFGAELKAVDLTQLDVRHSKIKQLVEKMQEMKEIGDELIKDYAPFSDTVRIVREKHAKLPDVLRDISAAAKSRAEADGAGETAEAYLLTADLVDRIARRHEADVKRLEGLIAQVEKDTEYVRKAVEALGFTTRALEAVQIDEDVEIEKYAAKLNAWIGTFRQLMKTVEKLSDELDSKKSASPPKSPGVPRQTTDATPARPVEIQPLSTAAYRAKLATLRQSPASGDRDALRVASTDR